MDCRNALEKFCIGIRGGFNSEPLQKISKYRLGMNLKCKQYLNNDL